MTEVVSGIFSVLAKIQAHRGALQERDSVFARLFERVEVVQRVLQPRKASGMASLHSLPMLATTLQETEQLFARIQARGKISSLSSSQEDCKALAVAEVRLNNALNDLSFEWGFEAPSQTPSQVAQEVAAAFSASPQVKTIIETAVKEASADSTARQWVFSGRELRQGELVGRVPPHLKKTSAEIAVDGSRLLGSGASSTVLMGSMGRSYPNVAVKKLRQCPATHRELEALEKEASIMASVPANPYILPLYGLCLDPNFACLVTDAMERGSLNQLIHAPPAPGAELGMTLDIKLQCMVQIAAGLQHLHANGLLHRDLKPDNVLVDKESPPRIKLADFGSATSAERVGRATMNMGTLGYSAPETVRARYSVSSDVFSFGMTLWEVVTGHYPLRREAGAGPDLEKMAELMEKATGMGTGSPLWGLIQACLHMDPASRPGVSIIMTRLDKVIKALSGAMLLQHSSRSGDAELAAGAGALRVLDEGCRRMTSREWQLSPTALHVSGRVRTAEDGHLLQRLGSFKQVKKLTLRGLELGPDGDGGRVLPHVMPLQGIVSELAWSNNGLNDGGVDSLLLLLRERMPVVETLSVAQEPNVQQWDPSVLAAMTNCVTLPNLKLLSLSGLNLGPASVGGPLFGRTTGVSGGSSPGKVSPALSPTSSSGLIAASSPGASGSVDESEKHGALEHVLLSFCQLRQVPCLDRFPALHTLDLSGNPLTKLSSSNNRSLSALAQLTVLNLSDCNLASVEALGAVLESDGCQLGTLILADNKDLADVPSLFQALGSSSRLARLDLSGTGVGPGLSTKAGSKSLVQVLEGGNSLRALNVSNTGLRACPGWSAALLRRGKAKSGIMVLNVSGNDQLQDDTLLQAASVFQREERCLEVGGTPLHGLVEALAALESARGKADCDLASDQGVTGVFDQVSALWGSEKADAVAGPLAKGKPRGRDVKKSLKALKSLAGLGKMGSSKRLMAMAAFSGLDQ